MDHLHLCLHLQVEGRFLGDQSLFLSGEAEDMRWFMLPSEAQLLLMGQTLSRATTPFQPMTYPQEGRGEGGGGGGSWGHVNGDDSSLRGERIDAGSNESPAGVTNSLMEEHEAVTEHGDNSGIREKENLPAVVELTQNHILSFETADINYSTTDISEERGQGGRHTLTTTDNGKLLAHKCLNCFNVQEDGGGKVTDVSEPEETSGKKPRFHHPPKRILKPTIEVR